MHLIISIIFCALFIFSTSTLLTGEVKNPDALLELTRQKAREMDSLLRQIEEDNQIMAKYLLLLFSDPPRGRIYDPGIYTVDENGVYGDHGHKSQTNVWFKGESDFLPEDVAEQIKITEPMEKRYKELKRRHSYIQWTYVITVKGLIRVYPSGGFVKYPDKSYPQESAVPVLAGQEKNPQRQTIWTEPYRLETQGDWIVTCATPLYQNGLFLGVQAVDIKIDELKKDKALRLKEKDSLALLIGKNGDILVRMADSKESKQYKKNFPYTNLADVPGDSIQNLVQKLREGREGVIKFGNGDAVQYFAFVPLKITGWGYGILAKL
jgi:hypothetical protein